MNYISYYEIDKLINIINSFNGIIFGEFARDYYIDSLIKNFTDIDIDNLNINIIFNSEEIIKKFIRILNQHFEINKKLNKNNEANNNYYLIFHSLDTLNNKEINISKILNLNIIENINSIKYNYNISKLTNNIDLNLLAFNQNSLFLLQLFSYYNFNNYNNMFKYSFNNIYNKKFNKRFSILFKQNNLSNYINNLDYAYNIIKKNFIMDDIYDNNISIFFKWGNIDNNVRLYYSEKDIEHFKNITECTICSSKFNTDDIVINTRCNHNFHWECCNNTGGLKNWIENFKISCPICRKTNLNFI